MHPPLVVATAFIVFAVLHSITISPRFKRWLAGQLGDGWTRRWYRAVYTIFSAVTTAAAVFVYFDQQETFLYRPGWPVLLIFHLIQFFGLWLVTVAAMRAGIGHFLGLRQAWGYSGEARGTPDLEGGPNVLWTTGIYGLVRHPMYLGGILAFLFEPNIAVNCLVVRALATAYFVYGAAVEERKCVMLFGKDYLRYKERVPRFNIVAGLIRAYRRQKPSGQ